MMSGVFSSPEESHSHSLHTLETLYEYDDFMESVGTLADMGCGSGLDLEWWATRTTRDERRQPLNIRCTGIDLADELPMAKKYANMFYQRQDFETEDIRIHKKKFDVIWCHDAFQYVIDPFRVLQQWHRVMNPDGMLVLILPQTTNIEFKRQIFDQRDGVYWNWTMVSLIHVLAVSGFDCAGGFFKKNHNDPWLHAVVYRSSQEPRDPRATRWWDLADAGLLPQSAVDSLKKCNHVRQRDLILPWLDKSLTSLATY